MCVECESKISHSYPRFSHELEKDDMRFRGSRARARDTNIAGRTNRGVNKLHGPPRNGPNVKSERRYVMRVIGNVACRK